MGNILLNILDDLGFVFLPEKHSSKAYGIKAEKPGQNPAKVSAKVPAKNRLKLHPEFVEQIEVGEDGETMIAHVNEGQVNNALTDYERAQIVSSGLDLRIAAIVKREKIKPPTEIALSNREIAQKYHTPGSRDGFSTRNVAKYAKIVAPAVGGGGATR